MTCGVAPSVSGGRRWNLQGVGVQRERAMYPMWHVMSLVRGARMSQRLMGAGAVLVSLALSGYQPTAAQKQAPGSQGTDARHDDALVRLFLKRHCLGCHAGD